MNRGSQNGAAGGPAILLREVEYETNSWAERAESGFK